MQGLQALISGGGLGGLTAALALAASGQRALVCEQGGFAEAGAGIQLSPNCVKALHALGLEPQLRQCACLPEATHFRHWRTGAHLASLPLGAVAVAAYGAPHYHIHRGDLLALLLEAAANHPGIELLPETRVEAFAETDGLPPDTDAESMADADGLAPDAGAESMADASGLAPDAGLTLQTSQGAMQGDLLIGADGIHSQVRRQLWGGRQPRFTGCVAWRALVPAARLPAALTQPAAGVWWGPRKHLVHYPVLRGELVNCVCVVERQGWEKESWTERGSLAELQADFAGWHDDLQRLLSQVDAQTLYKWALFDRPPLPAWGKGAVTLLGDACHPALPFVAQGAAMAMEDAAVLSACLQQGEQPAAALQRYEALRRRRTTWVQRASRRNARIFHLAGPAAWLRNLLAGPAARRLQRALCSYAPPTAHFR